MNKAELKEKLNKWFKGLPEKMKDALYPEGNTCDICGEELVAETRYHLCAKCTEEMPFIGDHICLDCGVQIDNEADYCDRCQRSHGVYKLNRSPLIYDGKAREMVHALKFGGKKYLVTT
ncbi:MAG: hypothetical protein IJ978_01025, partial [Clostridia bacterium]|nr:hypothetical protein [Clostridia bacterium]